MPKAGTPAFGHGFDVGAGRISGGLEDGRADAVENGLNGAQGVDGGGRGFDVEAQGMGSARVALDGGDVVGEVVGVFGGVGLAAGASGFLVHPGDDAKGAGGAQVEALENFGGLHGHDYAGSVVDGAGAKVPGIEMAGDDYDLLGVFGAFEIGDYVVAGFVRKLLRSEGEVHADFALGGEMDDQVGVFGGDGGGGDSGGEAESGVRETVVGTADGANQGGDCAEIGGGFGSGAAIADGLAVGGEG